MKLSNRVNKLKRLKQYQLLYTSQNLHVLFIIMAAEECYRATKILKSFASLSLPLVYE